MSEKISRIKNTQWKNMKNYIIIGVALLLLVLFDALGLLSRRVDSIMVTLGINLILALSLSLIIGYLGELSLGHAGFMCIGAFLGKFISMEMAGLPVLISFPIALIVGGLAAAFFGFLIGLPTMRLRGDYLAIVTLAFGEIVRNVVLNIDFLGGPAGLKGDTRVTTYFIAFVGVLITLFVIQNLIRSRHGRAIRAIKNNDIAARSVGINVTKYKLLAFIISAFFAGIAGVLYSHNTVVVNSSAFSYNRSIEILVFVVLGGMGSITGTIVATTVLTLLPEMLKSLQDYRMLMYSIVLITIMITNASPKFNAYSEKVKKQIKAWFCNMGKKFIKNKNVDNSEVK